MHCTGFIAIAMEPRQFAPLTAVMAFLAEIEESLAQAMEAPAKILSLARASTADVLFLQAIATFSMLFLPK